MLWEVATTLAGGLLNINPYDQPAVQLGKEYTFALMGKSGYEKQAKQLARRTRRAGRADRVHR
jgi:glucose-6-phosphate isomerase